ncbi:hypothetical protein GCM10010869_28230 [Mesorhizobium tianshanense]|uniref:Uncharacterized protein n=1 Tax=Mesorhizobium tianshanense TaxID=39844 RepID=A0A562MMS4_9HYPH|nr:hypothetical protein [Mesorhizobium tianshanense]TWI21214.1 hypothetical protein IQ26_06891 [Mesorhizobium tianshanense]GLS37230.1 hypothetical protein GCM10010869_28230 [Mesorhizobium tianshanense]
MFNSIRRAFTANSRLWDFAGYWANVVVEHHKITGLNLEQIAKALGDQEGLDDICRRAMKERLSSKDCAVAIIRSGLYEPVSVDGRGDPVKETSTAYRATSEAIDEAQRVQRELTDEFARSGLDFMTLHPIIHGAVLAEALAFGRIDRTVEMFFEIAEMIGRKALSEEDKAKMLLDVWKDRAEMINGPT